MSKKTDKSAATKESDVSASKESDDESVVASDKSGKGSGNSKLAAIIAKEILSAKATLPDLPSKKNGTHYESWRDTVTDDLKTSIFTITKGQAGGKDMFKHYCELIQSGNPDTTFPADDNLSSLLANLHVAVRKCVHKLDDSEPLLNAIKEANMHTERETGLSNGILSLRALDSHYLKRAILERKDGLKKFQNATLTDLTQSKKWMQTLKTNAKKGKVDPFLVLDKIHTEFKKHELTKYSAEEFYQRCKDDEIDETTVQEYVESMEFAVDALDTDDAFKNAGPKSDSPQIHVAQNEDNRGYKTKLCQKFLNGHCRFGKNCYNKHGENEVVTEAGKARYLANMAKKGTGSDGKEKDVHAMINAAVAAALASANVNAASATAPSTSAPSAPSASGHVHPSTSMQTAELEVFAREYARRPDKS